ncbi:MAG: AsmA family protein [Propylenella sp.]
MKRIAGILATFLVAAVALVALLFAVLPREALKTQIGQQISGWTGREVSLRGEPRIDFFPPLSVTLNDVTVSGPSGMTDAEIISMDRLTGTIRLAPLIIGRVEIDSFVLVRPLIRLVRDEAGGRNWAFDAGAAALQLAFAGDVPLGVFSLEGGTILYEDRQSGETERLDSVNLTVEWTSVRAPLAISGSAIWRGEQVMLTTNAAAPFAFLNDQVTPLEVRIESAPVSVVFTGEAQDYPLPEFKGALKLSTVSLRRFANWLGSPIGPGSTLGQASLFGTAEFSNGVLSVADAELTLDGNSASGALEVTASTTPDIAGTLAFGALDLTPYFGGLAAALSTAGDWREVELPTRWFRDMNADIRLSANTVKLGSLTAGATAATASLREARLEIGLARAEIDGGSLAGDVAFADADIPHVEVRLRANDIDLAGVGPAIGLPRSMTGSGSAVVDVATGGRDLGSLIDGLDGTARLDVRQGSVPLFGIAGIAATAGLVSDPGPADSLAPVPVEAASAGFTLSNGVAVLERGKLVTSSYGAEMQGWIGLRDGTLGLNGTLQAAASGSAEATPFPFGVEGTLADPQAEPQALAN